MNQIKDFVKDFKILTTSPVWVATPWDYNSARYLRFISDDYSECCYGYGQIIYAVINFHFAVTTDKLSLYYFESPAIEGGFKGFTPAPNNVTKEIEYELVEEVFTGSENLTRIAFKFQWILKLKDSPFPKGLKFPYEIPLEYYGYREDWSQ